MQSDTGGMKSTITERPYQSYLGISPEEEQQMLKELGLTSTMDLFSDVPSHLLLKEPIQIPGPFTESELDRLFRKIAKKNKTFEEVVPFLGGGVRPVYIPAFLEELMRRGEIYTAYTSYQPEVAQGMLQMVYEYESMIAELTGMEVVSASLYDWGTALGESARMMCRITRKSTVVVVHPISPRRLDVLHAYTEPAGIKIEEIHAQGDYDIDAIRQLITEYGAKDKSDQDIAGIYFEAPTYHGVLSSHVDEIVSLAHEHGILVTVGVDLISLGILRPPSEYNADFVIGEGQILGNAISAGGPLLGVLATKFNRKWIQNFPGRLVGKTTELNSDNPGYCITLSTREQHIRRQKATSNICTNQTLMAVNAGIYLAGLGSRGIQELAQGLMDRAYYLANKLNEIKGVTAPMYSPFFAEFVAKFDNITHNELEQLCIEKGVVPGIPLDIDDGCARLISVSDIHQRADLDHFVNVIDEVMNK